MSSSLGDGLFFIVDIEGNFLFASPALLAFNGHPPRSGEAIRWPELVHPDDVDYVRRFCGDAFRRRCSFAAWWRIIRHDGVFVWAMIGGTPLSSQHSNAPIAYMETIDPLTHFDAFRRAGGVIGPDVSDGEAHGELSRIERLADMTLMASGLARDMGEMEIVAALDEPLRKIGFRLAGMSESPQAPAAASPSASYQRAPLLARTGRRRLASRG